MLLTTQSGTVFHLVMDTTEHDLGQRLTAWMEHIGVSARQLAAAGGVHISSVSRYVCNDTVPPLLVLNAMILKGLGMGIDRFWGPLPRPSKSRKPAARPGKRVSAEVLAARAAKLGERLA